MKKHILTLALTLSTVSSFAATTANLQLKGVVQDILSIDIAKNGTEADNLNLHETKSNLKLATLTEKSNSKTGYKVTLSSANSGKLVRVNGDSSKASETFLYEIDYNNKKLNLNGPKIETYSGAQATSINRDVGISYQARAIDTLVAGDYTDTITFTIAPN